LITARVGTVWARKAAQAMVSIFERLAAQQDPARLLSLWESYNQLRSLLPLSVALRLSLAHAYREFALPRQALRWYNEILAINSVPPAAIEEALAGKIAVARQAGEIAVVKQAGAQYEQQYPQGRWIDEVAWELGEIAMEEGRYEEAKTQYALVLAHTKTKERRLHAQRRLLAAHKATGEWDQVLAGYRELLQTAEATPADLLEYADVLFEQEQYQKAAATYERLIEMTDGLEQRLWVQYRLARSYQQLGKRDQAKALFDNIVEASSSTEGTQDGQSGFATAIVAAATAQQAALASSGREK
ncbi:MAG: hypothetical protein D6704_09550, partial [Nitrospirae bacterium]